jgi:hypothetical protein
MIISRLAVDVFPLGGGIQREVAEAGALPSPAYTVRTAASAAVAKATTALKKAVL